MGLDGVELMLSVEEEFEIDIDDADAANLLTPRMLADYVVSRLRTLGGASGRCRSQCAFYRIRSVLVRQFAVMRKDVHPASPLDLFLTGDKRHQWRELTTAIGARHLPRLRCKTHIYYPLTLGLPLAAAVLLLYWGLPVWIPLVAFAGVWVVAYSVADRLANVLPSTVSTVGALVPYVPVPNREDWSRDDVLQRVIQLTAVQIGVPVEKIQPDHHFVKDLGLGS